jgi:hypothetical protein
MLSLLNAIYNCEYNACMSSVFCKYQSCDDAQVL